MLCYVIITIINIKTFNLLLLYLNIKKIYIKKQCISIINLKAIFDFFE